MFSRRLRGEFRHGAVSDEQVDTRLSHVLPGEGMCLFGIVAELQHIADDGDLPPAGSALQHQGLRHGFHGVGARVVAVFDDRDAALLDDVLPHAGGTVSFERGGGIFEGDLQLESHADGGQRVINVVFSRGREFDPAASLVGDGREDRGVIEVFDVLGTDLCGLIVDREPADPIVRKVHGGQHVIVFVEQERRTRFHPVEELELRGEDALSAAEVLDVGDADVRDDADVRQSRLRQRGDLAFVVHAQFKDESRVFRFEPQQDFRESDLVVPVFIGLVCVVLRVQDTPDHLFGRGLPHTAGEGNDRDIIFQPVRLCKV